MVQIIEDTAQKIRNLPISHRLRRILAAAWHLTDVDTVRVTSGGQMARATAIAKGATIDSDGVWRLPNGRAVRIGSTRHDDGDAADLMLEINGQAQDFTSSSGRRVFEAFAESSAALGCTGLGAGVSYMGKYTMHVGFGSKAVWAKKHQPPLNWLVKAVNRGWNNPIDIDSVSVPGIDMTGTGRYRVIARPYLNLRAGPGTNFHVIGTIDFDQELEVVSRNDDFAKVDLQFDGMVDGFSHGAYLRKV